MAPGGTARALEVRGLSLRLGDRLVLDELTFDVPPGRVVGLLGPNGAGKTSTMRVLFGIVPPDDGEVLWQGQPAGAVARRRWGYLPQERGLYPKMRVLDHVVYVGRLRGLARDEAGPRAATLLERVGLADRAADKVERLSGGMQQRLQLACTLVHDPDVLVLDEPFSGLDPAAVDQLSDVVREQAARGRTVVFSSHQLDLVEDLCETIVLVDAGRVVLAGELRDLRAGAERRTLRIALDGAEPTWPEGIEGASVLRHDERETLLELEPGSDAMAVLDRIRRLGEVRDFGLVPPRLSELFRNAVRGGR